jgi:hypothetical protein
MALQPALRTLSKELHALHEALMALRVTSVEDKPLNDDVVLVDLWGDAADDLLGWVEGAQAAAAEAQQAAAFPVDVQRAWRELSVCQERFSHVQQRYSGDLATYERIDELMHFGRQRGGEWESWANGVRLALDDCRPALYTAGQAISACWQEIGERLGMWSVSVQTTAIGQQSVLPQAPAMPQRLEQTRN